MPHDESFSSPLDGIELFRQTWRPEGRPRAAIVFAHGMLEHAGRHGDWAAILADRYGIAVSAADARGHGRSAGRRAWVDRFDHFTVDYGQMLQDTAERFPGAPLFAMGFSMGGAIATLTALTKAERIPDLAGLILVAPAIRFRGKMFPALHFTASLLDCFAPQFSVIKPGFSSVSRDPQIVRDMQADPLVHKGMLLLHFGTEILRAMRTIQKRAIELKLPLLMLQGSSDWVVTPSGAEDFVREAGSRDRTLKMYPGLYHDLLHEPEREIILDDLVRWANDHLQPIE